MKLYSLDKREIRSFRLRHRTLELKSIFEEKNSFGMFMMAEPLHPTERILNRKDFIKHNLKVTTVSKKTAKFISKDNSWKSVQNLLLGNVILIRERTNKELSIETLNFLLKNNKMSTRFLFWNQNIYRSKDINKFIKDKNNIIPLEKLIKRIALTPLIFLNPFMKHSNNKGPTNLNWLNQCAPL